MSIEHGSNYSYERAESLSIHDQVLVQSASVIDQNVSPSRRQRILIGELRWAEWNDSVDGTNFQLQELTEQINPEEKHLSYRLIGYNESPDSPFINFTYDSYSPKVYMKEGEGKVKKCKQEAIDILMGYLLAAPTKLTDEDREEFVIIMQRNEVKDPRFRVELKRVFASGILRLLGR